jgi:hypothetical protein
LHDEIYRGSNNPREVLILTPIDQRSCQGEPITLRLEGAMCLRDPELDRRRIVALRRVKDGILDPVDVADHPSVVKRRHTTSDVGR